MSFTNITFRGLYYRESSITVNSNKLLPVKEIEKKYRDVYDRYKNQNEEFDKFAEKLRDIDGFVGSYGNNRKKVVRIYDKENHTIENYYTSSSENRPMIDVAMKEDDDLLSYVNEEDKLVRELLKMRFSGDLRKLTFRQDLSDEYNKLYVRIHRLEVLKDRWAQIFTHAIEELLKKIPRRNRWKASKYSICVNGREYIWEIEQKSGLCYTLTDDTALHYKCTPSGELAFQFNAHGEGK